MPIILKNKNETYNNCDNNITIILIILITFQYTGGFTRHEADLGRVASMPYGGRAGDYRALMHSGQEALLQLTQRSIDNGMDCQPIDVSPNPTEPSIGVIRKGVFFLRFFV